TAGQADQALAPRWRLLVELAGVLGLAQEAAAEAATGAGSQPEAATIEALIEERRQAKANRDFSRADAIRAQLQEAGIELVDKPGGVTIWLPKA
ncbi:MAG: cysteine--tRNA ligase, partial [Cyanobacteriota bacterium]